MKSQKHTQMRRAHRAAAQMKTATIMTDFQSTNVVRCGKNTTINTTINITIASMRTNDY